MKASIHVLQYLKNEPALGIFLSKSPTFDLLAYCDADWAACSHTRKSVSGFVIFLGNTLISWKSKNKLLCPSPLLRQNTGVLDLSLQNLLGLVVY